MREDKLDTSLLKQFSPFKFMGEQSLEEAASKASLISKGRGKMLFKREDERRWCHWIVQGTVDLVDENYDTEQLDTESESPDHMLDENYQYQRTAVAVDDCVLIEIDQDELDLILTVDQAAGEPGDDNDWMTRLLQSRLFELIPPANIQALFGEFSAVQFERGDTVIKQGEEGDYFYVVKSGLLSVDRTVKDKAKHLAKIGPGDFFGEDALVRNSPRNATITMLTRGTLMRLGKTEFNSLMVQPASEFVTSEEVNNVIEGGEQKVTLLDVSHPREIEEELPKGTINIPLQLLRNYTAKLNKETVYVVTTPGRRAELGAFILNQAGFDTYILKD